MFPTIQIDENSEKVTVFWELAQGAAKFRLYWSKDGITNFQLVADNIPNHPCYGKSYTKHSFYRSSLGLKESDSFFLAISYVSKNNIESARGVARQIPYLADQRVDAGASNSPIVASENLSTHIAANAQRVVFTHDVVLVEIFNNALVNSMDFVLYVDVTGQDASVARGMPVYPRSYYTVFRNLSKSSGVSLISGGSPVDTRIVVHY